MDEQFEQANTTTQTMDTSRTEWPCRDSAEMALRFDSKRQTTSLAAHRIEEAGRGQRGGAGLDLNTIPTRDDIARARLVRMHPRFGCSGRNRIVSLELVELLQELIDLALLQVVRRC